MKIAWFRLQNYKSFLDSDGLAFADGMNVLVGENNAGKTALLQALSINLTNEQHRSLGAQPIERNQPQSDSILEFNYSITGKELAEIAYSEVDFTFQIYPDSPINKVDALGFPGTGNTLNAPRFKMIWEYLVMQPTLEFKVGIRAGRNFGPFVRQLPSHGLYRTEPNQHSTRTMSRRVDGLGEVSFTGTYGEGPDLGLVLFPKLQKSIYRFSAERFALGHSPHGSSKVLEQDARNLAEVLSNLQPDAYRFQMFVELVSSILPQVKWISVENEAGGFRIYIWNVAKETMRRDLAVPLQESGTGVGQVIAILYVAFTSTSPRCLLIDEPQSFLHPGAARKLIAALNTFGHHQYIISTHSPYLLAAADPEEIIIVRNIEGQSKVNVISKEDNEMLADFLLEIGTNLGDVFGYDRVIWVEGATEEVAFRILVKDVLKKNRGTAIIGIRNTGDLEGADARKIVEIYNRLSSRASLLPSKVSFALDDESRTEDQKREMRKLSDGKIRFLPRRTFENYLLIPEAIQYVLAKYDSASTLTVADIKAFIVREGKKKKYWAPNTVPSRPNANDAFVNASLLLKELFSELSEQRVSFKKTTHSIELFRWVLANSPEGLAELQSWLMGILSV